MLSAVIASAGAVGAVIGSPAFRHDDLVTPRRSHQQSVHLALS
jgi:hypothetical protein